MSNKNKKRSVYPKSVRVTCMVLAALTVIAAASTILYIIFA